MKGNRILAMVAREIKVSMRSKGRFVGEVVVPLISIVIWGMLASSGIMGREASSMILSIQIIWTLVYTFQSYANVSMMYDIWSREVGMVMSEVSIHEYVAAKAVSSFIIVFAISSVIIGILYAFFSVPLESIYPVLSVLPAAFAFSLSVSLAVFGIILVFGRTYDFMSWSIMSFVVFLSFPFSVPPGMSWIRPLAEAIPLYHVFAHVREGTGMLAAYLLSVPWLVASYILLMHAYRTSLKTGMLVEMST